MNTLYLVRGLPGSGKSTLAKKLAPASFEADDFFTDGDGVYTFDPSGLKEAHNECQANVAHALAANEGDVAVANTFSEAWETEPYFDMALKHGYTVVIIECQTQFGSIHGVPEEAVDKMRKRWEADVTHSVEEDAWVLTRTASTIKRIKFAISHNEKILEDGYKSPHQKQYAKDTLEFLYKDLANYTAAEEIFMSPTADYQQRKSARETLEASLKELAELEASER